MLFISTIQGLVMQSTLFRNEAEMLAAAKRLFPLLLNGFRGKEEGETAASSIADSSGAMIENSSGLAPSK